jgi:hypothetical protein
MQLLTWLCAVANAVADVIDSTSLVSASEEPLFFEFIVEASSARSLSNSRAVRRAP